MIHQFSLDNECGCSNVAIKRVFKKTPDTTGAIRFDLNPFLEADQQIASGVINSAIDEFLGQDLLTTLFPTATGSLVPNDEGNNRAIDFTVASEGISGRTYLVSLSLTFDSLETLEVCFYLKVAQCGIL